MSKTARLPIHDVRAILSLVGECRDLGDDPSAWPLHLGRTLARLTGSALSTGGKAGGILAGRPRFENPFSWGWENGVSQGAWLRGIEAFAGDPTFSLTLNRYGDRLRREDGVALTRTDLVGDEEHHAAAEYWAGSRPMGVYHSLACFRSLPGAGDAFTAVSLWRVAGERDYSPRDRTLLRESLAAVAPLVGGPLAGFGEPSPADLPPRVRDVLGCLLEGDGDKQVALRLGLTRHTVNQYAKIIFRHFGVSSRPELLARWVRRAWGRHLW